MMSDEELVKRCDAILESRAFEQRFTPSEYIQAACLCHMHQFTAAAEGLLEAAERMVGIVNVEESKT